jgi:seryl-tRNA synthetase
MSNSTGWDFAIEVFKKHGLISLILLYACFNHYDNRVYERTNDKLLLDKLIEIDTQLEVVDYKLDSMNFRINRLEEKVFANIEIDLVDENLAL